MKKLGFTVMELVIVIGIIGLLTFFFLLGIGKINLFSNESTIKNNQSTFTNSLQSFLKSDVSQIAPASFDTLFTVGDQGATIQGFNELLANCSFSKEAVKVNKMSFITKFKVAAVGDALKEDISGKTINTIINFLDKLNGNWKVHLVYGAKADLLNGDSTFYNDISDNLLVIINEHNSAKDADFYYEDAGTKKYYNVTMMDSSYNITDSVDGQQPIRDLFMEPGGNPNQLSEMGANLYTEMSGIIGTPCAITP